MNHAFEPAVRHPRAARATEPFVLRAADAA